MSKIIFPYNTNVNIWVSHSCTRSSFSNILKTTSWISLSLYFHRCLPNQSNQFKALELSYQNWLSFPHFCITWNNPPDRKAANRRRVRRYKKWTMDVLNLSFPMLPGRWYFVQIRCFPIRREAISIYLKYFPQMELFLSWAPIIFMSLESARAWKNISPTLLFTLLTHLVFSLDGNMTLAIFA